MNSTINFSFKRMAQVAVHDFCSNRRRNVFLAIVLFGAMFIGLVLMLWTRRSFDFHYMGGSFSIWAFLVIGFGSSYAAADIMRPMHTKAGRLSYLMLPASMLEKFVSRLLYVTVGYVAISSIALLVLDALYQIFIIATQWDAMRGSLTLALLNDVNFRFIVESSELSSPVNVLFVVSTFFVGNAFWVIGGSLWYSYAFGKTLAAQTVLGFVVIGILVFIAYSGNLRPFSLSSLNLFFSVWAGVDFVVGAFLYWASYKLFTKSQVISRYNFFLR